MADYSKSVIYCISCRDKTITECYVGSSANFEKRKLRHKDRCNNLNQHGHNYKVYQFIRENGGWDNFEINEIENYPCQNEIELNIRENYWMDILQSSLNCRKAPVFKNIKEWREANIEHIKQYSEDNREKRKERHVANKEQLSEKRKEKMTCQCGKTFRKASKARHDKTQIHIKFNK